MKPPMLGGLAIAALLIGPPAVAAEMAVKAPPPPAAPAYYSWTGFYIGANAGYEWADTSGVFDPQIAIGDFASGIQPVDQKLDGGLAGGQIGYNYQFHHVVLGIDFSGSWDGLHGTSIGSITETSATGLTAGIGCFNGSVSITGLGATGTVSCTAKQEWTVQVLPRLGYTFADGRLLPYITGGVAVTKLHTSNFMTLSVVIPPEGETVPWGGNRVLTGGVLGAGLQYGIGNGLSFGVEYLYAKYSSQDFSGTGLLTSYAPLVVANTNNNFVSNQDLTTQTVRLVINYNFGD